ncbi:MAG TPA: DUF6489 family protein [Stellaceae bacterium]
MKISVNVDCTPEEARSFFGLPDVKPMQAELLKQLQDRLSKNIQAMDPEVMVKTWLSPMVKGFEQWQEVFLSQVKSPKK